MAFTEDLSAFFSTADFAVAASYTPQGPDGETTIVNGIFDREYVGGLHGLADDSGPAFQCATAAVPAAGGGDTLVIEGTTYVVTSAEPDGTGVTLLRLRLGE